MNNQDKIVLLSLFLFDNKLTDSLKIKRLYSMSNDIESYYDIFKILKRNGKYRKIYAPKYTLKKIQKSILENILEKEEVSNYSKGYIKGFSLVDNATSHTNKNVIVKLDIKYFFDSINFVDVYNIYNSLGYSKLVSGLLAHLSIYDDFLPQGAPTSPYLSNLYLKQFDYDLGNWCNINNITYTRYSDDLTFSMDSYNKELIRKVRVMLYRYGLELNNDKIHVVSKNSKQFVTGIVVNKKVSVDRKYKSKIRQELYYINKYGLVSHMYRSKIINKDKYLNSLLGRINYVLQIEKENREFIEYKKIIKEIK